MEYVFQFCRRSRGGPKIVREFVAELNASEIQGQAKVMLRTFVLDRSHDLVIVRQLPHGNEVFRCAKEDRD